MAKILSIKLSVILIIFFYTASVWSKDYIFETVDQCQAFQGIWINLSRPALGRCELQADFTLSNGDSVYIPAGVTLTVINTALRIRGSLYIANHASLNIRGGQLDNSGVIDNEDDGLLQIRTGIHYNSGTISSEGRVEIFSTADFIHSGTIRNYGGGDWISFGTIIVHANGRPCEFNNDIDGTFTNRGDTHILNRCRLNNRGDLINRGNSLIVVIGELFNWNTGTIQNYSQIINQSGSIQNNTGIIENKSTGLIWSYGNSNIINTNSGTITNEANATIQISSPAIFTNQNTALIDNELGAVLFIDDGTFNNSADIVNAGRINNDITNNHNTSNITNGANGHILNQSSGIIHNVFGYFNNLGVIENNGRFFVCFGAYTGNGMYSGNRMQFCAPNPVFPEPPRFPGF